MSSGLEIPIAARTHFPAVFQLDGEGPPAVFLGNLHRLAHIH